jgi:hypothetical protein
MLGNYIDRAFDLGNFRRVCTVVAQQKLGLCSNRRGGVDSLIVVRPTRCWSHLNHALPRGSCANGA